MDISTIPVAIGAILGVAAVAGAAARIYKRNYGKDSLEAAQTLISMQKEENTLLIRKNNALQTQLDVANNVIERLSNGRNHTRTKK